MIVKTVLSWALLTGTSFAYSLNYQISLDEPLDRLTVEVCASKPFPRYLTSGDRLGQDYLLPSPSFTLMNHRMFPAWNEDGCFHYHVDLAKARSDSKNYRVSFATDDALMLKNGLWLWRQRYIGETEKNLLQFQLSPGQSVSVPFPPATADNAYEMRAYPLYWAGRSAFGVMAQQVAEISDSQVTVSYLGKHGDKQLPRLLPWITQSLSSVFDIFGAAPFEHLQILIAPVHQQGEATPFAQVYRGGGPSAHFFINESKPLQAFLDDWTAYHEFSHLLLPYVRREDAWLSEGLATYYQYRLMALAGQIDEQEAWRRITDDLLNANHNFEKTRHLTLAQATREMHETRSHPRVYWSGALMWLQADLELRHNHDQTLDGLLAHYRACCSKQEERLSAREVISELNRLSGTSVFKRMLTQINQKGFPDFDPLWKSMGIAYRYRGGGSLTLSLNDKAPLAELRRTLMGANNRNSASEPE